MAQISTRDTLLRSLGTKPAADWPHVWVTNDGAFVVGEFPTVRATFDFGTECFREAERKTELAPTALVNGSELQQNADHSEGKVGKERISLIHEAARWTETIEIETPEYVYMVGSAKRALITGLEIVEDMVPGTLERLSKEKGKTKRPVSRNRDELYDMPSQRENQSNSSQLKNGFWVATNNKGDEALGYVERAVHLAKLDGKVIIRRKAKN